MLTIDEINTLTKSWIESDFDNFIHNCFKDGKAESRYRMEADVLWSKHLGKLNLAYVNTDEPYHPVIILTDKGRELRDSLNALEDSPRTPFREPEPPTAPARLAPQEQSAR